MTGVLDRPIVNAVPVVIPPPRRPLRCLRHHVWLASCDDCRAAHQPEPTEATR